jgi:hypothetical protein
LNCGYNYNFGSKDRIDILLVLTKDMVFIKKPLDKRSKAIQKGNQKLVLQSKVMEGPKRKVANVLLPSKHYISSSYNFRDMLLREETHQCDKRSLPWDHPPRC